MSDLDQIMWEDEREVPDLPLWLEEFTFADARSVYEGGCDSGAWMPAVTYSEALEIMNEYGDQVITFLQDEHANPYPDELLTWRELAVFYLSVAVELFSVKIYDRYLSGDFGTCYESSEY